MVAVAMLKIASFWECLRAREADTILCGGVASKERTRRWYGKIKYLPMKWRHFWCTTNDDDDRDVTDTLTMLLLIQSNVMKLQYVITVRSFLFSRHFVI